MKAKAEAMREEIRAEPEPAPDWPLVAVREGVATTTTLDVAAGTGVQHHAVIQLARKYQSDLEEFGRVAFEMQPFETAGGIQQREFAILNEQQATLLLTYMRNTDIVRAFKKRLVKEFFRMAEQLRGEAPKAAPEPPPQKSIVEALAALEGAAKCSTGKAPMATVEAVTLYRPVFGPILRRHCPRRSP